MQTSAETKKAKGKPSIYSEEQQKALVNKYWTSIGADPDNAKKRETFAKAECPKIKAGTFNKWLRTLSPKGKIKERAKRGKKKARTKSKVLKLQSGYGIVSQMKRLVGANEILKSRMEGLEVRIKQLEKMLS